MPVSVPKNWCASNAKANANANANANGNANGNQAANGNGNQVLAIQPRRRRNNYGYQVRHAMLINEHDLQINRFVGITADLRRELRRVQMRLNYFRADRNLFRQLERRHWRQLQRIQRHCLIHGHPLPGHLFI